MPSIAPTQSERVIIGIDPHPTTHTAAALNVHGRTLATLTLSNTPAGHTTLRTWAEQFPERCWAIEGAGNSFIRAVVDELLTAQEHVTHIPPSVTAQYRARRTRKKTDEVDAIHAARALLANPDLPRYAPPTHQRELQELCRAYTRTSRHLKSTRMALRASSSATVREALGPVVQALESSVQQLRAELRRVVRLVQPELLGLPGVGPVVAGVILAEVGDVRRFPDRDRFASFAGCAPVTRASGAQHGVRVNAGGNRRLNWAMHLIVMSRLRTEERSQVYRDRKLGEGKSSREVWRCLKTHVAREVFGVLKGAAEDRVGEVGPRVLGVCH